MKLNFTYNRDKDIWCLLEKGPSSQNSKFPTGVYKKLVAHVGENPDKESASKFIDDYLKENNFDIESYIIKCEKDFSIIEKEFHKKAEEIFKVSIPKDITVFLTVNNRCPYNLEENWFFVSLNKTNRANGTIIHELWHFYTFYKFGDVWNKIGHQKYNDLKESLTVLLNIECKNLLPEGIKDEGYPQHQDLREQITELWSKKPDLDYVWEKLLDVK